MDDMALVIGDHDSITLFGAGAQADLKNVTKNISRILLNDNCKINVNLVDIINGIEKNVEGKHTFLLGKIPFVTQYQKKETVNRYMRFFRYVDKVTLQLQLQQAQLLKNTKVLEQEDLILEKCIDNLEKDIVYAENILLEAQSAGGDCLGDWSLRLERKIQDLKTTKIVSSQSRKQIQLMCMNNRNLIDKIISLLSNALPLWRTQISIALGIEEVGRSINMQKKIGDILEKNNKGNLENREFIKRFSCSDKINFEMLNELDSKLNHSLKELVALEDKERMFRVELTNTLS